MKVTSLDSLTATQLDTAAWDLRNAALVVDHAGHAVTTLVNQLTGGVCAAGAIDLATKAKLGYVGKPYKIFTYVHRQKDSEMYRAENAYNALAEALPTALCDRCNYSGPCECCQGRKAGEDCIRGETAWDKVTHYNDNHCTGGPLLAGLLRLSADRAQIAARERRTMLAGRLLETV